MSDQSLKPLSLVAGFGIAGFLLAVVGWLMPWVDHQFATGIVSIKGSEVAGFRLLLFAVPGAAFLWLTTIARLQLVMALAATVSAAAISLFGFVWIGEITGPSDDADASRFVGEQLIGSKLTMLGSVVALCCSYALLLISLRQRAARLADQPEIAADASY